MLCQIFSQVILEVSKKSPVADAFVSCLPHSAATPSSFQEQNSLFLFFPNKKTNQGERETRIETSDLNCSVSRANHVPGWKILATKKLLSVLKGGFQNPVRLLGTFQNPTRCQSDYIPQKKNVVLVNGLSSLIPVGL